MIKLLTLSEMLLILENQIRKYGGSYGVKDLTLLSYATYLPETRATIPSMAAAYAYHLCQTNPFADGNKRVALAASLIFLDINGYELTCKSELLYSEVMKVVKEEIKEKALADFFEANARERSG